RTARKAARRALRRLTRRLARLEPRSGARRLHKTRVAAKRLRYLQESLELPLAGRFSTRELARLQDALGALHDRAVVAARLKTLPRAPGRAAVLAAARERLRRERPALRERLKRLLDRAA
ncbi:MAG: CHAD domain-containing protein, partial [Elusimicrobiota bacterium]|nr:CHAD domain-containing protein [Elusimicrobiota bacterium]